MSRYSLEDHYQLRKGFEMEYVQPVIINDKTFNIEYVRKLEEKLLAAYETIDALEYDLSFIDEDS